MVLFSGYMTSKWPPSRQNWMDIDLTPQFLILGVKYVRIVCQIKILNILKNLQILPTKQIRSILRIYRASVDSFFSLFSMKIPFFFFFFRLFSFFSLFSPKIPFYSFFWGKFRTKCLRIFEKKNVPPTF